MSRPKALLLFAGAVSFLTSVYLVIRVRFERGPQEAPRPLEQTRTGPFDARSET